MMVSLIHETVYVAHKTTKSALDLSTLSFLMKTCVSVDRVPCKVTQSGYWKIVSSRAFTKYIRSILIVRRQISNEIQYELG